MTQNWLSVPITLIVGLFAVGAIWLVCLRCWERSNH